MKLVCFCDCKGQGQERFLIRCPFCRTFNVVAEPSDIIASVENIDDDDDECNNETQLKVALKHILALSKTRTLAVPQVCGSSRDSTIILFHAPCESGCYTCTMSEIQIYRRSAASNPPLPRAALNSAQAV